MNNKETRTLDIKNDITEIGRLSEFLEALSADWDISQKILFDINLSLEELVTNIIHYGFEDDGVHSISLTFGLDGNIISISMSDDGFPFNPLTATRPDVDAPLEKRKIGGLGIHLVRNLMDSMDYERKSGHNVLQLTKRIR